MTSTTTTALAKAGKYLTFGLADEHYAIEILRVQEIVGLLPVTRVPRLPACIAGVVNLRGRIIPVVDLRLAFGLQPAATTERSCIIVVTAQTSSRRTTVMGALVDGVSDVIALASDAIEPAPDFGPNIDLAFVNGVGRADDRVVLMLDIDKVLSDSQMSDVESVSRSASASSTAGEDEGAQR